VGLARGTTHERRRVGERAKAQDTLMMSRARVWEEMRSTEAEGRRVTATAAPTMSGGEEVNRKDGMWTPLR
jgi:hypothetical protein